MKIPAACAIGAALLAGAASPALAHSVNTGRPSYDNPRDYDRDAYGNETYYRRNTWFGPNYYYDGPRRPHAKKKHKKKIHHD